MKCSTAPPPYWAHVPLPPIIVIQTIVIQTIGTGPVQSAT